MAELADEIFIAYPMPYRVEILKSSLRTFHTQGKQFHPLKLVERWVF